MPVRLTEDDVRHVARLARLQLADADVTAYRDELTAILDHIATLERLDVEGVAPLSHPLDLTNRLDEDEPASPLPVEALLAIAPSTHDRFLTVPKVLEDGGSA